MGANQGMQDSVKSFVKKMLSEIKVNKDDEGARIHSIRESLLLITQEFTTEKYTFNLAMDVFVEAAYKNLSECLVKILAEADFETEDDDERDIYFAAYYALSLIRKKQDDVAGLMELLDDKYASLSCYPLHYEVHSRYYKRVDKFSQALSCDKRAINILNRKNITNVALCISYASTVCTMLKRRDPSLSSDDIELAQKYIGAAIEFNPDYPKYYFLKAQLTFLSAVHAKSDAADLVAAGKEAVRLIDEYADVILYELYHDRNVFVQKEREKYDEFKGYIDEIVKRKKSPRFIKSDEELDLLKEKILSAQSQDVCVSSAILPPLPVLHKDDKYFFICYSSRDFQSVYCDLIELYKRKVPFRYDERLKHGEDWKEQIKNGIRSENCAGVVFYLSKNVLSTNSVCKEIDITEENNRGHFCVNLEGSTLPSRILTDLIIERYLNDPQNYAIPGDQMQQFLNFFSDDQVFTHKFKENGPDGTSHFDSFVDALLTKFPQIIIGD